MIERPDRLALIGPHVEARLELDEESREDLARLYRFLDLSERFELFVLRFDADGVLDHVVMALRARYGERFVVCALPAGQSDADPVVALMQAARDAGVERPIVLQRGFDAVFGPFGERTKPLRVLNERRDLLPMHLRGPLVIALRPQQLQQLREHAPDLWSIYTAVFSFRAMPFDVDVRLRDARTPWLDDPDEYGERIERLAQVPGDEATRLRGLLLGRRALALAARGELKAAEDDFARGLDAARASGDVALECDLLTLRAGARLIAGMLDGAERDLRDAWTLAERLSAVERQARLHHARAELAVARGRLDEALSEAKRAEQAYDTLDRPRSAALARVLQGDILKLMRRGGEAEAEYAAALGVLKTAGGSTDVAAVLLSQAHLARQRADFERGFPLYDEALRLFREAAHLPGIASALAGRGLLSSLSGDSASAANQLAEARKLYEKMGALRMQAQIATAESGVLLRQGRRDEADRLLTQALVLACKVGDAHGEGRALLEQGRSLMSKSPPQYDEAQSILEQAARTFAAAGAVGEAASAVLNRGDALLGSGNVAEATACYRDAAAMAMAAGVPFVEGMALLALGDALSRTAPLESLQTLERAESVLRAIGDTEAQAFVRRSLERHRAEHPELDVAREARPPARDAHEP